MSEAMCGRWVKREGGWPGHRCGVVATEDVNGAKFCKRCAATERRSLTARKTHEAKWENQRQREAVWKQRLELAERRSGIKASLDLVGG